MNGEQRPTKGPRPEGQSAPAIDWQVDERLRRLVDRSFLESVLAEALSGRRLGTNVSLGVVVTDDRGICDLNRRYRGVDAATDVLSFPLLEYESPEDPGPRFPLPPGKRQPLGDIVISYERAVEQAKAYSHSQERELAFLLVHGIMHLLGYDHDDPEEAALMRVQEESVLGRLGLTRPQSPRLPMDIDQVG